MKDKLFYHVRNNSYPHTYCVIKDEDCMLLGYSVTHKTDNFCKKTGRNISENRANTLKRIYDNNNGIIDEAKEYRKINIHQALLSSINNIIYDSKNKFEDVKKVVFFNNINSHDNKMKKIPVMMNI